MKYIIETRGLTKRYGEQRSVEDLSLHVRPGRIYGLLGRNGAGKTTTMRMLLGLTRPSAGSIRIFGQPMPDKARSVLPRTGSLIESPGFYPNLTGSENLRIFAILRRLPLYKNPVQCGEQRTPVSPESQSQYCRCARDGTGILS